MSEKNPAVRRPESISVPLRMPKELKTLVETTARTVKLSEQDTIRLGLERGLEVLKRQLAPESETATPAAA